MDINNICIRTATIDDLAPIFHLGETLFTSKIHSNLYRTWDEYAVTHLFNTEPDYMLVAEKDEQVIGFALGSVIEKARSAWNYGHLVWLGVHPDFARFGVGNLLFEQYKTTMKESGVRMLMVDTQADNNQALKFFAKQGFGNPIDHVYMTLKLETDDE